MIIPKLYGRLGNQCFQIAASIGQAKRMGTQWAVPPNTNDLRIWPHYFLKHLLGKRVAVPGFVTRYYHKEPRHCFDPLPPYNDLTLDGYWQSEQYFAAAKAEVAQALGFNVAPTGLHCAVHIRRGDYLLYPNEFPVLPMDYYQAAIDYMIDKAETQFRIYTDDEPWCAENLKKLEWWGAYYAIVPAGKHSALDVIRDLYTAESFIVANSSFSLFPAILRADNPLVVAPAEHRWYGPANAHLETRDLMPERFVKL